MNVGGGKGIKAEINVTPMVDVVLVLLIIFMVITPMLQRGKDVQLPKAMKVDDEKKGGADPIVVSVPTSVSTSRVMRTTTRASRPSCRRSSCRTPVSAFCSRAISRWCSTTFAA
jgi:biopolymer transport protein ExbD